MTKHIERFDREAPAVAFRFPAACSKGIVGCWLVLVPTATGSTEPANQRAAPTGHASLYRWCLGAELVRDGHLAEVQPHGDRVLASVVVHVARARACVREPHLPELLDLGREAESRDVRTASEQMQGEVQGEVDQLEEMDGEPKGDE